MPQNETDLLNNALGQIGQKRIDGIDDGTINANWCKTYFPTRRRAALALGYWSFSEKRIALALASAPPAFEFAYAYDLPGDWIRIHEYNGASVPLSASVEGYFLGGRFKIENRQLLSNEGAAYVVYVFDNAEVSHWDPLFYEFVATSLAADLALAILHDETKSSGLVTKAMDLYLPLAASVDGQNSRDQRYVVDDLIRGR